LNIAISDAFTEIREHIADHYKRPAEEKGEPVDWVLAFLDLENAAREILAQLVTGQPVRWACPWCGLAVEVAMEESL